MAEITSYDKVISVLEEEIQRLRMHSDWERYGDRDGPHPPIKPEDVETYGQLLGLKMKHALEGRDPKTITYRITDHGWVAEIK